jgi:hypothetical protein
MRQLDNIKGDNITSRIIIKKEENLEGYLIHSQYFITIINSYKGIDFLD